LRSRFAKRERPVRTGRRNQTDLKDMTANPASKDRNLREILLVGKNR
jgi:hypothetical protein